MKTYHIPNTDLEVSRIAFGTMHLGGSWDDAPIAEENFTRADTMLRQAVDLGINLIDFADIYARGKSDKVIGQVLRNDPSLRQKLILQEKTGIILADELGKGSVPHYNFSYENIINKVENCLLDLHTGYLDILLLHRPDPLVEPEEVARAFDELHISGKVRYFGVSNHTPAQIELLKRYINQPLVINQLELNILHNDLINDGVVANTTRARYTGARDMLDFCRLHEMVIQAWSPVASGKLFVQSADVPDNVQRTVKLIRELADKHATTPEAIAIGWLLHHPALIQPVLGTMNPQRLIDSVKADDVKLSRLEWFELLAAANSANTP